MALTWRLTGHRGGGEVDADQVNGEVAGGVCGMAVDGGGVLVVLGDA